jgi:epoxyqueuosine reductase
MPSSTSKHDNLKELIRSRAVQEGFDVVGFAEPKLPDGTAEALEKFLGQDMHGDMAWMATTAERRSDPANLWNEARSVVTLGMNYAPAQDPMELLEQRERATISVYARGDDYHDVIKRKLKRVASWIATNYAADVRVFVDTAPVMEKPLAHASGIGWQGKHTNLVSREFGSWLFLGSIFTTLDLPPDAAEEDHCGSCRNCLDICPTKAFPEPYKLDARRCISYLTIEHKGHIPEEFREAIGNRIYGCDDCLAVCPWNKFAKEAREMAFAAREELIAPALSELAALDDPGFRAFFRHSPVKRLGRDRFVRNVLIAIGNSGIPALAVEARNCLADESSLVRAMAVWALQRLLPEEEFSALSAAAVPRETDLEVIREWNHPRRNPAR